MINVPGNPVPLSAIAAELLARCDEVALFSEEPGMTTRTFLSEPMRALHVRMSQWMREAGLQVQLDAAGNLIGHYETSGRVGPILAIGSHLDTVPKAGKYDGVLGILLGIGVAKALAGRPLPFGIDVIAFSEEEGVRYRAPFLGSLAAAGRFDRGLLKRTDANGITMAEAFRAFGLDPARIAEAAYPPGRLLGYIEAHIEQGPVLDDLATPAGVVEAITGQSRMWAELRGKCGHAGTTPMKRRLDPLPAAAEIVLEIERIARATDGCVATVGAVEVTPGAANVIPGSVRFSVDVRHARDPIRMQAAREIMAQAKSLADQRGIDLTVTQQEHHAAVPADPALSNCLADAIAATGHRPHRLASGAGHDAAIMAAIAPMAMLFLRSPGGVSHHPDEQVLLEDVAVGLEVLLHCIDLLAGRADLAARAT